MGSSIVYITKPQDNVLNVLTNNYNELYISTSQYVIDQQCGSFQPLLPYFLQTKFPM